ncbi:Cyclic di-GMP phosphodiesterase response regulator RpfG [Anaerohalosphaera lusitana]|uniref:Cyclic di-GMP phosphodiesterase response regulator RpfG n=1 Tax=Anaerohalosphaera lusitana TaxID=1936003 RepID=A0A1U9NLX4_9BACT|nr:HD domain-containing phosphohydrolase [Anaerohalosphaera lusitana]AQT68909.1 Cyclic di-GMP phosphodiesterase response regulator RpfG [Anaerohalosphaera lusitana]
MPETITKTLAGSQLEHLTKLKQGVEPLGAHVALFDQHGSCLYSSQCRDEAEQIEKIKYCVDKTLEVQSDRVCEFTEYLGTLSSRVNLDGQQNGVLIVDAQDYIDRHKHKTAAFCHEHGLEPTQCEQIFDMWDGTKIILGEMLRSAAESMESASRNDQQIEIVSTELAQTYEELVLLYNMSTNMKVTQSNATYLQMACDQVTQMVDVEGIAVFMEKSEGFTKSFCLTAGSGVVMIDQALADIVQARLSEELRRGQEALLDSDIDSPFSYDWPESLKNIIAVPLQNSERMIGFMVATNIINKSDFDSNEVKLFNSVANQCAVFIDNGRLFGDLKELFMGALKALTNSIDAKDQYTRGHSERVAFISRWIAERLTEKKGLSQAEIDKIYLAGLLHDIGKIGIDEKVLRKNKALTDSERGQIMSHPRIGSMILADIKQMKDIVQGVLCHHERYDGKGYPEGLAGENVPLMGRIISVADSFDAMTSKRVYRDAMGLEKALSEIEKGSGTQFDADVVEAFINSDIRQLWRVIQDGYQDGFIEAWDYDSFLEYGTRAVGTLLR